MTFPKFALIFVAGALTHSILLGAILLGAEFVDVITTGLLHYPAIVSYTLFTLVCWFGLVLISVMFLAVIARGTKR